MKANAGADDGQTWLATNTASAGPYKLKSWERGTQMTIERDPNYYRGWGDGAIDEVRFIVTNDEATVRSMAASGELTMTSQYQSPDTYDTLAKLPRFKVVKGDTSVAFYLKLNSKAKPTDDLHIRKAIALATDYDTIRSTILPGGDLNGPLPKTFAAAYLELARAEVRHRRRQGGNRKERIRRSERYSAVARLCLRDQVRGGARASDAGQSGADRLQGDAQRRAVEPHHRDRLESRNDAEHRGSVLRPDLSFARTRCSTRNIIPRPRARGRRWSGCRALRSTR